MFKDDDAGFVLLRKLDHAAADPVGLVVVAVAQLLEERDVILFSLGYDAGLAAVLCNPAKLPLPKAIYRIATTDECRGEDRTFGSLDGTHGDIFA
jgi:hypothetical protein